MKPSINDLIETVKKQLTGKPSITIQGEQVMKAGEVSAGMKDKTLEELAAYIAMNSQCVFYWKDAGPTFTRRPSSPDWQPLGGQASA